MSIDCGVIVSVTCVDICVHRLQGGVYVHFEAIVVLIDSGVVLLYVSDTFVCRKLGEVSVSSCVCYIHRQSQKT